ncbi:MAG TPA: DNA-3-methyladenine glycosylase 2 family protein [Castellaniella sp.]|uniref:DNA-3-methyladenine glycosylase family protein n=1 Tax=Castellaniella sp. TaxID=1955812 RepID=UPI002F0A27EE
MRQDIQSSAGVRCDLKRLLALDARLVPVSRVAGEVLPRTRPAGFEGLARIICGQQLSVQSADAIWGRLVERQGTRSAQAFLALDEGVAMGAGLSRTKYAYLKIAAQAVVSGELNLGGAVRLPAQDAIAALTRHKGIGPWTAEIYLMFCAGHPDIFPVGDLALRKAVADAFEREDLLDVRNLVALASRWAPYRSTAALLFWRFYAATRRREGV